ncbi:unnamed protein product [Boreogadus saida]
MIVSEWGDDTDQEETPGRRRQRRQGRRRQRRRLQGDVTRKEKSLPGSDICPDLRSRTRGRPEQQNQSSRTRGAEPEEENQRSRTRPEEQNQDQSRRF